MFGTFNYRRKYILENIAYQSIGRGGKSQTRDVLVERSRKRNKSKFKASWKKIHLLSLKVKQIVDFKIFELLPCVLPKSPDYCTRSN
jgi:hypothetical protein